MAMSHGLRICSDDGRPVDLSSWEANHAAPFIIVRQGIVLACLPICLKLQPPQTLEQHTHFVESVEVAVYCRGIEDTLLGEEVPIKRVACEAPPIASCYLKGYAGYVQLLPKLFPEMVIRH